MKTKITKEKIIKCTPLLIIILINIILVVGLKVETSDSLSRPDNAINNYVIPLTIGSSFTISYLYLLKRYSSIKLHLLYPTISGIAIILYWVYQDSLVFASTPEGILVVTIWLNILYAFILGLNYKYKNIKSMFLYPVVLVFSFLLKDFMYLNETQHSLTTVGLFNDFLVFQIFVSYFIATWFIMNLKKGYVLNLVMQILLACNFLVAAISFYVSDLGLISGAKTTNGVIHFWIVLLIQFLLIIVLSIRLNTNETSLDTTKLFKNKIVVGVSLVVVVVLVGFGITYSMRNLIINQIAINNYVEAFDEETDDAQYSTYVVGEDIDPGLYTATYKYSNKLRLVSKLLSDSESSTVIGVKIYKAKQDMEIKVKMYSGSDYHNLYLEDGDRIEVYTFADQGGTWLPNLVEQDSVVEYSNSEQLAGFYMLSDEQTAVYDDNFGSSENILYEYNGEEYRPRMFMPYNEIEDDVVASDGDIIYLESETLMGAMNA